MESADPNRDFVRRMQNFGVLQFTPSFRRCQPARPPRRA